MFFNYFFFLDTFVTYNWFAEITVHILAYVPQFGSQVEALT